MRSTTLQCAEIRDDFVAGRVPAGPAVEAHVQSCVACRELFEGGAYLGRALAQSAVPEGSEPGELFTLVEGQLRQETGLRARLRALPTPWRVAAWVAVSGGLLGYHLVFMRRPDFAQFSSAVFWAVVALLGAAIVLGASRVARGPTLPLSSRRRDQAVALALLALPALAMLLAPIGSGTPDAAEDWGSPGTCFGYGAALVAPLVLLFWLFERRDQVPGTALASAGALAGVAANLLLHAHCPSVHVGHLLLGHASIGAAWAVTLRILAKPLQLVR